ncbi:MAG: indole-3-glycerol phosphate synthase [Actinomycetota bacterium]|nr:MAG: indole-3-glycerol phosphate synthase [Actinomycetota bacterium]
MGFLTEVVAERRAALAERPLDAAALARAAAERGPTRDLAGALRARRPALIAEVKRASPSAGAIAPGDDPVARARAYEVGGAAAVSVLTEERYFGGSLEDLRAVAEAVGLPVLRKDVLVDPTEVLEARAAGADAVLVIAAAVDDARLADLLAAADEQELGVLLEAHGDEDLDRALATPARVIGVNARDLETLEVDLAAALARLRRIPADRIGVLESGVRDRSDVQAALEAGAAALLVGEALMRAPDPAAAVRRLLGAGVGA